MKWTWVSILAVSAAGQPSVNPRPFKVEEIKAPPGFEVSVYANVSASPRLMTFGPNGVLYAAAGSVVIAVPEKGRVVTVLSRLSGAHSVQFAGTDLYVSQNDGVYRYRDAVTSDFVVRAAGEKIVDLPSGGGHSTRTVAAGPDGRLYMTAGSTCNFCVETDPRRAAMMRTDADGRNPMIFARGLRNPVGFAWHPVTGEIWANDNGGDGVGEDAPPEEINIVKEGADYGWPDCYAQQIPLNWGSGARPGRCSETLGPEVEMQAHSAPLGLSFYTGGQFPAAYLNDAFVAFHGSWNRSAPTGYKVVRVRAASGKGAGYEDFLWGFLDVPSRTRSGRPVHALNGPDGALYVSDDANGNIYRVSYAGPRISPGGFVRRAPRVYEMYGANLAIDPAQFTITANGVPMVPLYAGPSQVNFELPEGIVDEVRIAVTNGRASDEAVLKVSID